MKNGDFVAHKENGIVGTVIKTYKPTGAERQTMIKTIDGREYHAPEKEWVKLKLRIDEIADLRQILTDQEGRKTEDKMLNPFGEYVVKFAENHGISIKEAYEEPMVKARREFFERTGM